MKEVTHRELFHLLTTCEKLILVSIWFKDTPPLYCILKKIDSNYFFETCIGKYKYFIVEHLNLRHRSKFDYTSQLIYPGLHDQIDKIKIMKIVTV